MLLAGAVLTFFSFIGFEDMLNVAEEVKEPRRTMPWGIMLALAVVTVSVHRRCGDGRFGRRLSRVGEARVRRSGENRRPRRPLASSARTFDFVTLFAVANTVLINYIMGSRLLYGMARQGLLPAVLGRVHATRRTPHIAIFTLLVVVLVLAVSGGQEAVDALASATGLLLLFSFMVVNTALIVLKLRPQEPAGSVRSAGGHSGAGRTGQCDAHHCAARRSKFRSSCTGDCGDNCAGGNSFVLCTAAKKYHGISTRGARSREVSCALLNF